MTRIIKLVIIGIIFYSFANSQNADKVEKQKTPIMGWSSWNNFRANINEDIIKAQADAMVKSGMKDAGYKFINIDDGFFGGRDSVGNLLSNPTRFPKGMKVVADYIHSKGLKAGIYSEAGINTCAAYNDEDTLGSGAGLFGHELKDIDLLLNKWGYDFLKVDWCGAERMNLNKQARYTAIGNCIKSTKPSAVYNICCWDFPGEWATYIADSWRISGDIRNRYRSIMHIVDLNADLWKHASPGHVNDMDMLQVGRGMSYDEDKTHFSMWCMMASPLLAGNDLTKMSQQTIDILTNKEVIAINQDPLVYQARRMSYSGDLEVWAKPLISTMSGNVAVALINRSSVADTITFDLSSIDIVPSKGYTMRDLWTKTDYKLSTDKKLEFVIPSHGIVLLKVKGTVKPFNKFQH